MSIPGFDSAQRQWENMLPPEEPDECEDGNCSACLECLASEYANAAEDYAEMQREDARLESRFGE